ncbi:hypothetical protein [Maridesulfovibrio sp. FT414]|uniref:hypothetical protein n=1 Tax=Maridesulfovibrio sp. FT414 TaxID=2979469 RepID=UPI003D80307D
MKVYTKIVIDFSSGKVEHAESYEYHGPVALCGGSSGGGGGDSIDKEYNARMATIYEAQQAMSEESMDFWRSDYKPMEREQIAANRELIPYQKDLAKDQITAQRELLPLQTETSRKQLGAAQTFIDTAVKGVDVDSRVSQAESDVKHSFGMASSSSKRDFSRAGLNTNSGRYGMLMKDLNLSQAQAVAGARTMARRTAEEDNLNRLKAAASYGMA